MEPIRNPARPSAPDSSSSTPSRSPTLERSAPLATDQLTSSPIGFQFDRPGLRFELPPGRRCGVSLHFDNDNISLVNGVASSDDGRTHGSAFAAGCRLTDGAVLGAFQSMEMFTERNAQNPAWSNWDPGAERLDILDVGAFYGDARALGASTELSTTAVIGVRAHGGFLLGLQAGVHDALEGTSLGWGLRARDELPQAAPATSYSPLVGGGVSLDHRVGRHVSMGADAAFSLAPNSLSDASARVRAELHASPTSGPFLGAYIGGQVAMHGGNLRAFNGAPLEELTGTYGATVGWRFDGGGSIDFTLRQNDRGTQRGFGRPEALTGSVNWTLGRW